MTVELIGSGVAADAVEAALTDVETPVERIDADQLGNGVLTVVTGDAGATVFEDANERALDAGQPWVAVELGGIGGIPIVDAAVSFFPGETPCYECLSGRVNANLDQGANDGDSSATAPRFAGAIAGREIVRELTGEADIFGRVITLPYEEHRLLGLPNCLCDPQEPRPLDRTYTDRSLDAALARAEQALDRTVGIVQEVGEVESFPVPYYLARACDTAGFSDASAPRDAAGADSDWNAAFMKALGEALERYCAGVYRTETLQHGAPESMDGTVDPSAFVCKREPDPSEEIEWARGKHLHSDESVLIPAEFVYHPPPESRYHSPVTTGLGFGNSSVGALLSGLYEVIERDAMMLSWYSSFEPLGLQVEDDAVELLAGRGEAADLSVELLLLTQDIDIPVVAAAVRSDEYPKLAFGTGADLDVTGAAHSALAEALQNWTELRGMGREDAADALGEIGQYASDPGPAERFADPGATVPAESVGPETVPSGEAELDAVLDRVASADLSAYGVRTTTRDVESLGFEAVRAVVPEAQPLEFGSPVFTERARTVPDSLGFESRLDRDHHPFP